MAEALETRKKNALTKYFIAPSGTTVESTSGWLRLGKWIENVTDNSEDTVEPIAYYDGDGSLSDDVSGVAIKFRFEGTYDQANEAMAYLDNIKNKIGVDRKLAFKIEDPDGSTLSGPATASEIVTRGGAANEFRTFGATIGFDEIPVKTPSV